MIKVETVMVNRKARNSIEIQGTGEEILNGFRAIVEALKDSLVKSGMSEDFAQETVYGIVNIALNKTPVEPERSRIAELLKMLVW